MKERISPHNKMIDGNWVLKRKRKRPLCRSDLSSVKESISAESSGKDPSMKPSASISRSGQKIRGNDGVSLLYLLFCFFHIIMEYNLY